MAATPVEEKLLKLFHDKWFAQNIIFPTTPNQQTPEKSQQTPPILSLDSPNFLVRSFSDQSLSSTSDLRSSKGNVSPDSVLPKTSKKRQTILSGKEVEELEEKIQVQKQGRKNRRERVKRRSRRERRKRRERSGSESLSELEFEELKGFMDLGFVFSEEDKDSDLASIIPGLQRLGKKQGNNGGGNNHNDDDDDDDDDDDCRSRVSRPYLSEAWELLEERKAETNPLTNWGPLNLGSSASPTQWGYQQEC
ncbi:hypothetical protein Cgig2_001917 [Carnegiea gigantea]|uniref:Uncharacterized protein n=1 Tax=Carnegiea gigantea TaxID=171969 RepID=A0A9Q1K7A0_9CARY|nr:hypothetical protein Cgig2_001917 [Carnegiea gigantea]